tara:strand:+ start:3215 stop:3448 length:234 start_codon:yes stop_codon:yes gene_type:complete
MKDPKTIVVGLIALAGVSTAGSMVGLTIEPESVTKLRVENAAMTAKLSMLEDIVAECSNVLREAERRVGEPTDATAD